MQKYSLSSLIFSSLLLFGMGITPAAHAAKNYTTEVSVYAKGNPAKGREVSLEFTGGIAGGGFTDRFRTNSSGVAYVKHASKGRVKVYIDGNYSRHGITGRAPGQITVHLSK